MNSFRLWLRRLLRFTLWGTVALVTLYALLYATLNWIGARSYERALARLKAEGETLDFKSLLPASVDPAKNFCAIESFRELTLTIDNDTTKGEPAKKRQALEAMKWPSDSTFPPLMRGVKWGEHLDLAAWSLWLTKQKVLPSLPPDAQALRLVLEARYPLIPELNRVVRERPEAEFTPTLKQRDLPKYLLTLPLPHYQGLMPLTRVLQLHGVACASVGQGGDALADARVMLRFATACQKESLLIGLLVAASEQTSAHEVLWHVLKNRSGTEAELQIAQQELAPSWESATLQAFRGELAAAGSVVHFLQTSSGKQRASYLAGIQSSNTPPSTTGLYFTELIPSGFFAWSGAHLIESELDHFIKPFKEEASQSWLAIAQQQETAFATLSQQARKRPFLHPNTWLTATVQPPLQDVVTRIIALETQRRHALIACALERYFLQHQQYPASLQALVPALLNEVPGDIIDGQPMRYRQTEQGRYVLWSIGFDSKDDNGKVNASAKDLYKDTYQGDWAWQYEPVK